MIYKNGRLETSSIIVAELLVEWFRMLSRKWWAVALPEFESSQELIVFCILPFILLFNPIISFVLFMSNQEGKKAMKEKGH